MDFPASCVRCRGCTFSKCDLQHCAKIFIVSYKCLALCAALTSMRCRELHIWHMRFTALCQNAHCLRQKPGSQNFPTPWSPLGYSSTDSHPPIGAEPTAIKRALSIANEASRFFKRSLIAEVVPMGGAPGRVSGSATEGAGGK